MIFRLSFALLRLFARVVPARDRDEWLAEWESELQARCVREGYSADAVIGSAVLHFAPDERRLPRCGGEMFMRWRQSRAQRGSVRASRMISANGSAGFRTLRAFSTTRQERPSAAAALRA